MQPSLLSVARTATVAAVNPEAAHLAAAVRRDPESRDWVEALGRPEGERAAAVAELHAYLLRVARFELGRRAGSVSRLSATEADDLAMQSADDALMAILRKLETFRGESRFTTWAAKFAILEASVKARRRTWQRREVTLDPDAWEAVAAPLAAADPAEGAELLRAVGEAIRTSLTPHQRQVLVAIAFENVPIDVLAERLSTTRGAIYKTLHDARRKLRTRLAEMEAI
jgi:RNA polymerase sigma-70 factor (ECF subfamily)